MDLDESAEERESGHDRWLVSYADFITLMFAFFTVLYATSEKNVEKTKKFEDSVKKYLIKAGAFGETGAHINQGDKHNSAIEEPIPTFRPEKSEAATNKDEDQTIVEDGLSKAEREKYVLEISSDPWGLRIRLPAVSLFAEHSDKFRPEAMPFINKLAALLTRTQRKILIEGHVASGETGGRATTWDFASARAINVLRYLEKREGFPGGKLVAASFADSRPLFSGKEAGKNSRIEIVLLNPDTGF
jgi:chemotaxis protein MotB